MENIEDPLFVQEEIPIRNELVLKLKIETIIGESCEIKNGIQLSDYFKSHWLAYDFYGNKTREQKYNRDGKVICDWIYGLKGKLKLEIKYDNSGKVSYRIHFVYDNTGYWKEKRIYLSSGEFHYRIVSNRDTFGKIITSTYYDSSGQIIRTDSYIYEGSDKLVKMNMGHMGEWIYEYDEKSNLKNKIGHLLAMSILGENFQYKYVTCM